MYGNVKLAEMVVFSHMDPGSHRHWQQWLKDQNQNRQQPLKALERQQGSYDWIRKDNSQYSRQLRLEGAFESLRWASLNLPIIDGTDFELCDRSSHAVCNPIAMPELIQSGCTVLEEAIERGTAGQVAVVSAANAYNLGGGFLTGGRHALEEAICTQTNIVFSLHEASQMVKNFRDVRNNPMHIPEDGAIISPNVHIFRHGTNFGYEPLDQPVCLKAVMSIAMPNLNYNVKGTPVEVRREKQYNELIENKWIAVLQGAARVQADILIVPDAGCGVFKNKASAVGSAFGRALRKYPGCAQTIVCCGSSEFFHAVEKALQQPEYASFSKPQARTSTPPIVARHGSNFRNGAMQLGMSTRSASESQFSVPLSGAGPAKDLCECSWSHPTNDVGSVKDLCDGEGKHPIHETGSAKGSLDAEEKQQINDVASEPQVCEQIQSFAQEEKREDEVEPNTQHFDWELLDKQEELAEQKECTHSDWQILGDFEATHNAPPHDGEEPPAKEVEASSKLPECLEPEGCSVHVLEQSKPPQATAKVKEAEELRFGQIEKKAAFGTNDLPHVAAVALQDANGDPNEADKLLQQARQAISALRDASAGPELCSVIVRSPSE